MKHPKPIDHEIKLNPKRYIVSKTNAKGVIEYCNDYFVEISGYAEAELIAQPHSIVRHPDMPKIVFKIMWERINNTKNIMAIVKNMAKDGSYYWVVTEFEPKIDPITNKIISHTAFRKAVPQKAIDAMIPIYQKLIEIEKVGGMEASEKYLRGFLEEKKMTYDEFIDELIGNNALFKMFFLAMKKFFS
ncbi:MAG: PAS domain-containing protein [Epsilonproteobacteria bacterium]|nr:PAS domain-containing protein [Campylobacterota bacterium]OIO14984.1 MAG: histidine kinase [Helicobacteraceae bacterium CG1_02_36_14]PIP10559.1 MAG: histidine kinase [Sulfurimonas sp. CG23_combo_of_CG06-09_8_20_14_all_36_33]PIS27009.1 MAG: histidine kinase [Sulfurimonas sp. CG08_land_8_20_14_0_20_36_33]PIU35903.1 MAG: histidine kinase [Sulfurimonas sp. CG07_land_8_20_14_0_80_36_56]PIV03480.1 MAG: histidine kinase [Sulfurimonas sp. CG03_land_8_20_14_0_80_36_25]PIV35426.1 MAG: histidine kina